jgi:hypothetical protein
MWDRNDLARILPEWVWGEIERAKASLSVLDVAFMASLFAVRSQRSTTALNPASSMALQAAAFNAITPLGTSAIAGESTRAPVRLNFS